MGAMYSLNATGSYGYLRRDEQRAVQRKLEQFVEEFIGRVEGKESPYPTPTQLKGMFKTKSAAIRHLYTQYDMPPKDIAKYLDLRYQQVRNALKAELKRGPNEDYREGRRVSDDDEGYKAKGLKKLGEY